VTAQFLGLGEEPATHLMQMESCVNEKKTNYKKEMTWHH
jgi:hypothetical protein